MLCSDVKYSLVMCSILQCNTAVQCCSAVQCSKEEGWMFSYISNVRRQSKDLSCRAGWSNRRTGAGVAYCNASSKKKSSSSLSCRHKILSKKIILYNVLRWGNQYTVDNIFKYLAY